MLKWMNDNGGHDLLLSVENVGQRKAVAHMAIKCEWKWYNFDKICKERFYGISLTF